MVDSSLLEDDSTHANQAEREHAWQQLRSAHAILVPGGFGVRGIGEAEMIDLSAEMIWHIFMLTRSTCLKEGKVKAITFAREAGIPFLGVCLGMQAAVIEYCRAFLNKPLANSKEFSPEISEGDSGRGPNSSRICCLCYCNNVVMNLSNYLHAGSIERKHGRHYEVRCTQDPSRGGHTGDGYL